MLRKHAIIPLQVPSGFTPLLPTGPAKPKTKPVPRRATPLPGAFSQILGPFAQVMGGTARSILQMSSGVKDRIVAKDLRTQLTHAFDSNTRIFHRSVVFILLICIRCFYQLIPWFVWYVLPFYFILIFSFLVTIDLILTWSCCDVTHVPWSRISLCLCSVFYRSKMYSIGVQRNTEQARIV